MAVMLTTSLGEMVVDLYTDLCPVTCKNFLKLCKIKYYNNCLFHSVQKDFIAQTGDPTGTGSGGESVYSLLYGEQARFFDDEIRPKLKHDKIGVVAMASGGENLNASQFYITTRADIDYLDGKHTIFGEIAEGLETLMRINEAYVDEKGRPYKNIRIKHTYIVDDPFDDPPELAGLIPERSPELKPPGEGEEVRLEDDWVPMDEKQDPEELEQSLRRKEAHSRAVVLEMIGDIPEAEVKPPENVLFICKLNPVTQDEDLEIIFARFGKVVSADIIRDYKTGDSLCYAFIEFETQEACEAAYFKMDNTLIDDRRIHVDFSQSVSRLWSRFRRFGTKDTGENGVMNGNKKGCFNCGEPGHLARDCTNKPKAASDNAGPPEPKKYELKEEGGQRGNVGKRYDMLFEEQEHPEPEPAEKPARKDHSDRHPQKPHEDKPAPSRKHDGRHSSREEGRARHRENDREEEQDNHSRRRPRHQTHRDDHLPHHHQRDRDRGVSDHSRERFDDRRDRDRDRDRDRGEDNRDNRDGRDRVPSGGRERKSWEERERRERERKEEARLDQEDREKEALEREVRDKKRKEKDSSGQEEEKQKEEAGGRRHDRSDSRDANRSKRRHREHRRDSGRRDH